MSKVDTTIFPEAEYKKQGLPEYDDNPLIAALPKIMKPVEVAKLLSKRPHYKTEEANLPGHIRTHAIHRLTRDFFVPQTNHIAIEQRLSKLIRSSYLNRNPNAAKFKQKLNSVHKLIKEKDLTTYMHDNVDSTASSTTIAGISGAGKSTTTNIILKSYPTVIYHPELNMLQVPWLKLDCPYDGSLADFCLSFFIALGRRLNINYRDKYTSGRPSIAKMMADVANLCLIHAIGLIVIDEFQHMSLAKSGGEKKMINFLVTLVNVVEVSVVLIGTPKALRLFSSEFRQARRASGDGSLVWDRMQKDASWEDFLDVLWPYQWLQHKVDRDESLTNKLYDLTQGIPDIVIKLFCLTQARAILLEHEELSIELFEQVFEDDFSIVKPMLDALRTGNRRKIQECNDLIFPQLESSLMNAVDRLVSRPLLQNATTAMSDPDETNIVNSAIRTLVSMEIAEDIAEPLVLEIITEKPDVNLLQIIQMVTTTLNDGKGKSKAQNKTKKNDVKKVYTSHKSWSQLEDNDFRKMHADAEGSMYETLKYRGYIYPVEEFLA